TPPSRLAPAPEKEKLEASCRGGPTRTSPDFGVFIRTGHDNKPAVPSVNQPSALRYARHSAGRDSPLGRWTKATSSPVPISKNPSPFLAGKEGIRTEAANSRPSLSIIGA